MTPADREELRQIRLAIEELRKEVAALRYPPPSVTPPTIPTSPLGLWEVTC